MSSLDDSAEPVDGDLPWAAAAQAMKVGCWRFDLVTKRLAWSSDLARLIGFSVEDTGDPRARLRSALSPASLEALEAQVQMARETGAPIDVELEILGPRPTWLRVAGSTRARGGRPAIIEGGAVDITELQENRARSAELAERLQVAVHGAGLGLVEIDLATRGLQLDGEGRRLHGAARRVEPLSLEEDPVLEDDRGIIAKTLDELEGRETVQLRYRIRASDGSSRWIELTGRVHGGARPVRVVGVVRDVTEAFESEARVRASEAQFRMIERSIDAVFWVADDAMASLQYVSPVVEELFGISPSAFCRCGGIAAFRARLPLEDRLRLDDAITQARSGGTRRWRFEHRIERSSGDVQWLAHSGSHVPATGDQPAQVVGVTTDITARRRLEEDMLRASKLEAVGHLAGGIAHDFNNLLSVISGYANVGLIDAQTEAEQESFQRITDASRQAAGLTRRLLLLGRPQPPDIRAVDIGELLRGLETFLRRVFGPGIEWRLEIAPTLPAVAADPAQIEQVLLNLAVNSRDAMDGEGTLRLGAAPEPGPDGVDGVSFWVEDNGRGIAPEIAERIFEPFFTTKTSTDGTGLGLPTVKTVLERLGGYVRVESAPGAGARFAMWLPASRLVKEPPQKSVSVPRDGPPLVAVVDDDDLVRSALKRSLRRAGLQTVDFGDARLFLQALDAENLEVDAVVSDVRMPGMSGLELVAELRRRYPGLPVLLVSGYVEPSDEALPSGVTLLAKPFSHEVLLERVRDLLPEDAPPPR